MKTIATSLLILFCLCTASCDSKTKDSLTINTPIIEDIDTIKKPLENEFLTVPELSAKDQFLWKLINKRWTELPKLSAEDMADSCRSIHQDLKILLSREPTFWNGRFLQAITSLTLNDNETGKEALMYIQNWGALSSLKPAYLDAYKARGWVK